MKRAGIEQRFDSETDSKGKQTLVLFLLGGSMLLPPLLASLDRPMPHLAYTFAHIAPEDRRQVVCAPEVEAENAVRMDAVILKAFSRKAVPTPSIIVKNDEETIPVELALFFNRPLPINKSRQSDLEVLPGVGPHLAAVLLAERQKRGAFNGPEDLLAVPGIGPATLRRLLPLVQFE